MFKKLVTTTAEDYREIVRFTNFKRKKYTVPVMIISAVVGVILLLLGIIGIIPIFVGIPAFVICLGVTLYFPVSTEITVKNGIKRGKVLISAKRTIEFDTMTFKIYGGRTDTDINASWHTIFAVYETDRSFLIYITYEKAFCLCKAQLTSDEVLRLRDNFAKRLDGRYFGINAKL
ncbi:MAG: YcxB family protein [Ruminiclostridium sp.]|nr:YcxB family protein [Ruminiclostridium sp.]